MRSLSRRLVQPLFAGALVAAMLAPSCAKQGEGERCEALTNGNDDCESGLVCIRSSELANDQIGDRCCPGGDQASSDDRCIRKSTIGTGGAAGTDGGAGSAGAAGTAGAAGSDAGDGAAGSGGTDAGFSDGSACSYTSQCPGDLICGPGGTCQPECLATKDCATPLVCVNRKCVTPVVDSGSG